VLTIILVLLGLALFLVPQYKIWIIIAGLVVIGIGSIGDIFFIGPWQIRRLREMAQQLRKLR